MENSKEIIPFVDLSKKISAVSGADVDVVVQSSISEDLKALASGGKIIKVSTQEEADNAFAVLVSYKERFDSVEAQRVSLVKPSNDKVKRINSYFSEIKAIITEYELSTKSAIKAYQAEQKKIADPAALKKKEDDDKAAEELRKKANDLLLEAKANEAIGQTDNNKELISQAKAANQEAFQKSVSGPVFSSPPSIKGFTTRTKRFGEVSDIKAFLAWVLKTESFALVEVCQTALDKRISADGDFFKADGVTVLEKEIDSVRRK